MLETSTHGGSCRSDRRHRLMFASDLHTGVGRKRGSGENWIVNSVWMVGPPEGTPIGTCGSIPTSRPVSTSTWALACMVSP